MQTSPQEAFSSSPPGSVFHFLGLLFRQAVSLSLGWQDGPVAILGLQRPYSQQIQRE